MLFYFAAGPASDCRWVFAASCARAEKGSRSVGVVGLRGEADYDVVVFCAGNVDSNFPVDV